MSMYNRRLSELFEIATRVNINDQSRIVIFSDCHRGDGSNTDNFARNENLYYYALKCYYYYGYTYIEAGYGDELWENKRLSVVVNAHPGVFRLLSQFYKSNRLYLLFGNHDMVKRFKKNATCVERYFENAENCGEDNELDVVFYEALALKYNGSDREFFVIHGNQADFVNYDVWRLTRVMVRYLWRPFESLGFRDPTNASHNYKKRRSVEKHLIEWADNNSPVIAGHTHKPNFPKEGEAPYFNSGSCVEPRGVTCIEINHGMILLVKWKYEIREDGALFASREVLGGPRPLASFFNNNRNDDLVPVP
jgi:predicted phosphodiesterase